MNDENQELNPQPIEQPVEQPANQAVGQPVELEAKLQAYYQISYGETRSADELWRKLAIQLETAHEPKQSAATFSADSEVIPAKAIYPLSSAKKSWRPFALVASLAIAVIALIAILIISADSVGVDSTVISQAITPTTTPNLNSGSDAIDLSNLDLSYPGATSQSITLTQNNFPNLLAVNYLPNDVSLGIVPAKIYSTTDSIDKVANFYSSKLQNAGFNASVESITTTCSVGNNCPSSPTLGKYIHLISGNIFVYLEFFTLQKTPNTSPLTTITAAAGTFRMSPPFNPYISKDKNLELVITGSKQTYYPDSPNESIPLSIYNKSSQTLYVLTCEGIILQKADAKGNWIDVAPDVPCPPQGSEIYSIISNTSPSANFVFKRTKAYTGQSLDASGTYRLNLTYYTYCEQGYNTPDGCTGKQSLASVTFQIEPGPKPTTAVPYTPTTSPETTSAPVTQTKALDINLLNYPNAVPLVVNNFATLPTEFTQTFKVDTQKAFASTDPIDSINSYFNQQFAKAGGYAVSGGSSRGCANYAPCNDDEPQMSWNIAQNGNQFVIETVYDSTYWQASAYKVNFLPLVMQLNLQENLVTIIAGTLMPSASTLTTTQTATLDINSLSYPITIQPNITETNVLKSLLAGNLGAISAQNDFISSDNFRKVAGFYSQKLIGAGYTVKVTPVNYYFGCPAYGNSTPPPSESNACVSPVIGFTIDATQGASYIHIDIEGDYYYIYNSLERTFDGGPVANSSLTLIKVVIGKGTLVLATPAA